MLPWPLKFQKSWLACCPGSRRFSPGCLNPWTAFPSQTCEWRIVSGRDAVTSSSFLFPGKKQLLVWVIIVGRVTLVRNSDIVTALLCYSWLFVCFLLLHLITCFSRTSLGCREAMECMSSLPCRYFHLYLRAYMYTDDRGVSFSLEVRVGWECIDIG